ncbi:MAG: hypothetical protein RIG62_24385 [Cyclobacteriaceae bacterium]
MLTFDRIGQINDYICQVFSHWPIHEIQIVEDEDEIALTVTVSVDSHQFVSPDHWKALPLPSGRWICVGSFPNDQFH